MRLRENTFLNRFKELDFVLILTALALTVYGIICVSSATEYYETTKYVMVQLFAAVLGIVCMLVLSLIDYDELLRRFAWVIYVGALLLLLLPVAVGALDGDLSNNNNWVTVPFINVSFQPSEVAKIMFVMSFGYLLGHLKQDVNSLKSLLFIASGGGIMILFVLMEKDLGAAVVFIAVFAVMCFFAGVSLWYFLAGAGVVTIAAPFIWERLSEYQQMRILVGFDPTLDPEGYGYQVLQTMRAMANGGVWGMGYGEGTLTHATLESTYPARETDVILGVMGEEFGFVGIIIYLILISVLIFRILKTARGARKDYGSYICVGVAAIFIFHTLENVGMCLGVLPVIGLTLPFISYGGSAMLSVYICLGVAMSVRTHQNKYYFEREKR